MINGGKSNSTNPTCQQNIVFRKGLSHLIILAVQVLLELAPKVGDGDKAFFQKMNIFIE